MAAPKGNKYAVGNKGQRDYAYYPEPEGLRQVLPFDCVPVAVDKIDGAIALPEHQHPERVFYIRRDTIRWKAHRNDIKTTIWSIKK